ncbi:hypothetical protein GALMADRAFT_407927 [Galerina marginata CBS 339.88]|uniref:Uncharacterized protein n=1 Tax=Galerina marginata (strain CBS 339.88) TaxID=685588 RepID=A0A067T368_GALM3|nr:hypothetical protein GALMADRAFT_407927 [Galerina marginata CBS 339.88]
MGDLKGWISMKSFCSISWLYLRLRPICDVDDNKKWQKRQLQRRQRRGQMTEVILNLRLQQRWKRRGKPKTNIDGWVPKYMRVIREQTGGRKGGSGHTSACHPAHVIQDGVQPSNRPPTSESLSRPLSPALRLPQQIQLLGGAAGPTSWSSVRGPRSLPRHERRSQMDYEDQDGKVNQTVIVCWHLRRKQRRHQVLGAGCGIANWPFVKDERSPSS